MKELEKVYAEDSLHVADEKLELIGLEPEKDVTLPQANEDIRVWCSVIKVNKELGKLGIKEGDKLLVFQSLRYTKESLEKGLKEITKLYRLLDIGGSFIGALIKT